MANQEHLDILKKGKDAWNAWRRLHPEIRPDLSDVSLSKFDLSEVNLSYADFSHTDLSRAEISGVNFSHADLSHADLSRSLLTGVVMIDANLREIDLEGAALTHVILSHADLSHADLSHVSLGGANLRRANFKGADLQSSYLGTADLSEADLREANLSYANLNDANLTHANLTHANLTHAILSGTNFKSAILSRAELSRAILIKTDFTEATLTDCQIYGISAWNVELERAIQNNLVITPEEESTITVDNLEVAQFIYLLLNNQKIRSVIDTIGQKGVLILGRFSKERKFVLDALREKLRALNYLPIVFDFERSIERDFTETIMTLAGLSCFIIADITNPKSSPLELQATVPNYMIPFVPLIQEGEQPFSMFRDLQGKYNWVLDTLVYNTSSNLINGLEKAVVKPALEKRDELLAKKIEQLRTRHIGDYL